MFLRIIFSDCLSLKVTFLKYFYQLLIPLKCSLIINHSFPIYESAWIKDMTIMNQDGG